MAIDTKAKETKQSDRNYTKSSGAVQCSGTTKKGSRCKHNTTDPSGKCWQHK